MIDHLLQYHGAVNKLKEIINESKLQYIYSNRLNIEKLRTEENILWSFAPHDISVILALVGKLPTKIEVFEGTSTCSECKIKYKKNKNGVTKDITK